jgi:hypothetical protein
MFDHFGTPFAGRHRPTNRINVSAGDHDDFRDAARENSRDNS